MFGRSYKLHAASYKLSRPDSLVSSPRPSALIFAHVFRPSATPAKPKAASSRRTPKHPAALPLDAAPPGPACAAAGVFARFGVRRLDAALAARGVALIFAHILGARP
jgi:hypothetical protein